MVFACAMRYHKCLLSFLLLLLCPCVRGAGASQDTVRVGLFWGRKVSECVIAADRRLAVADAAGNGLAELAKGGALNARVTEGWVELTSAEPKGGGRAREYVISAGSPITVRVPGLGERSYAGRLIVRANGEQLVLVNEIGVEEYLKGVLPSEVPAAFHPTALQAQAIVARTYTLASRGKHARDGFDLCDAWHCQVYRGLAGQDPRLNAAVDATAGLIITYEGQPIQAVYHCACGGRTAASDTAWPGSRSLPYLRSVSDSDGGTPWCIDAPDAVWSREIEQTRFASALARYGVQAPISAIEVVARDEGGRPREIALRGPCGEWRLAPALIRDALNAALGPGTLPSADFEAGPNGLSIVFAGHGSGHGVGLCQWGANARAKAGQTAEEILAHYYPGTVVQRAGG